MRNFYRYQFGFGVAALMLAGCAGVQSPIASSALQRAGQTYTEKFKYTGKKQEFKVPAGVTQVSLTLSGATGGGGMGRGSADGGRGGVVKATIPVTPGETLTIFAGGSGRDAKSALGGAGGFNGGGAGGTGHASSFGGNGGGGASDVRQGGDGLAQRVLIAAGGGAAGGSAIYGAGAGGAGGGRVGGSGQKQGSGLGPDGYGGAGGTQAAGGSGGSGGNRFACPPGSKGHNGKLLRGGRGGDCDSTKYSGGAGGGGGGGGYYGGGGGGAGSSSTSGVGGGGGGGGGSSFVEKSATHVRNLQGAAARGNGEVVVSWE